MISLTNYINSQLDSIAALEQQVIEMVTEEYQVGDGFWMKRGPLQRHIYNLLGFQGRSGNHFARYINKVMAKNGFRVSYYSGQRVYYGLRPKTAESSLTKPAQ